jgi:tRNA pseudouridine32 synthase/23S rRNA pseudouridine746 synthase
VAKTLETYHHLQRQFTERTVKKKYLALVEGVPAKEHGIIDLPLLSDPTNRPRQVVDAEHGKSALTSYQSLGHQRVQLIPHTGRTHQLRVHCAHEQGLHNPIKGDPLYGREKADRLYLHAEQLSFDDPETGERLTFHYPSPV